MEPIAVRKAQEADALALIELIVALAEFEKLDPPDEEAKARLIRDGFGPSPRFEAWLAFRIGEATPVGYAFTFETYSSFLARPTLYLEDIFVSPEHRGKGAGTALLKHCIGLAKERGCGRVEWVCLDWNKPAQCVYESMGARRMKEWMLFRMNEQQIEDYMQRDEAP